MEISYDSRHNVGYIAFQQKRVEVETLRISDELNIDVTPDGTIFGIELLNANEQLRGGNLEKLLVVVNEATGKRLELPLGD